MLEVPKYIMQFFIKFWMEFVRPDPSDEYVRVRALREDDQL